MKKRPTYQPMELLQRWLRGETRYEDEQQLGRQAAGDPFLAEALEGLRRLPEGEHAQRVANLKARVRAQSQAKRRRLAYLPRIAAAAAALVLLGAGLWYLGSERSSSPELALQPSETNAPPAASLRQMPPAPEASPAPAASPQAYEPPIQRTPAVPSGAQAASAGGPALPAPFDTFAQEMPAEAEDYAIAEPMPAARPVPPLALLDAPPPSAAQPPTAAAAPLREAGPALVGRVISDDGEPLVGATVLIPGTDRGTVTDIQGNFRLALEGEQQLPIEVRYTGFAATRLTAKAGDSVLVQLSSAGLLMEEVTVAGRQHKESKRAEAAKATPAPALAAPAVSPAPRGGFDELEKYLRRSLQYPAAALENGIEGAVELDFFIAPNGQPADFKVLRTPGYGCSEEAIRLLREGPPWAPAGQRARWVVEFKR